MADETTDNGAPAADEKELFLVSTWAEDTMPADVNVDVVEATRAEMKELARRKRAPGMFLDWLPHGDPKPLAVWMADLAYVFEDENQGGDDDEVDE